MIKELFFEININDKLDDDYANKYKTIRNKNWPYIPDHPYRMSI